MRIAAALAALLVAGCSPVQTVGVAEVLANCDAYKGKVVHLSGYLGDCGGYDCAIYPDLATARAIDSLRAEIDRLKQVRDAEGEYDRDAVRATYERLFKTPSINVGFNPMVEPRLTPHGLRYVIISGRIDSYSCAGEGTDRAEGIAPNDVRTWTKAMGAPADADDNTAFRPSTTLH